MKWTWNEIKRLIDASLNGKNPEIGTISILDSTNHLLHVTDQNGKLCVFQDTEEKEIKTPAQMIQEEKDKTIKDLINLFPNIQDIADTFNKKTGLVITNISFEFIFNRTFADYFPKGIVSNVHLDIKELK